MPDKILTKADLAEIERLAIERLKVERKEEIPKKKPNCHDCVYAEYQDAWPESRCELGEDWVGEERAIYRAALEPFARMFRWTNLPSTDDDAQVLWRKHWLTGERMKLTTEQFRLAALAFYHGGVSPDIPDGEQQLAVAMAEEMERWDKVKAMQAALDEFEEEDCD